MSLLTAKESGAKLRISERRVIKLIHEGRIKALRKGRMWLIEEQDLVYERKPRGGYRPRKPKGSNV